MVEVESLRRANTDLDLKYHQLCAQWAERVQDDSRLRQQNAALLAALKRIVPLWEEAIGNEPDYMPMIDFARKAIAEANPPRSV